MSMHMWNRKAAQTIRLDWGMRWTRFAALFVLVAAFSVSAFASCGDSMRGMAQAASGIQGAGAPAAGPDASQSSDNSVDPSIVGLWHVQFFVGETMIQEAFQIWNQGGTEVHNINLAPGGGVCLGTWQQVAQHTFKLAHRVWNYDASGNFLGTIHVTETLTLGDNGNSQMGTFVLDFYDPNGIFQSPEVSGNVVGTRISVE